MPLERNYEKSVYSDFTAQTSEDIDFFRTFATLRRLFLQGKQLFEGEL
jgi:hypothetical protein